MQWLPMTMVVEGKGDASDHGSGGSGDIRVGFRGESETESDGEDVMVGVLGSEVFFDGICGGGAEEGFGYDDHFRAFERHIDQTLEINEEEGFEFYRGNHSEELNGASKSDEIVSSLRALPGQISQQELMSLNHQSIASDNVTGGSKYCDGIGYSRLYLKRKRDRKDVKPNEYVNRHKKQNVVVACSMGSTLYRQFEDFLVSSKKYSPADKLLSQLKILAQNPMEDHCFLSSFFGFFSDFRNKNLKKQTDKDDKREIPDAFSLKSSLLDPVEDVKDSYWTDMVIQTVSSDISPVVEAARGNHVLNPSSLKLNVKDPNKLYRMKSFDYSYGPVAATNGDKISLAELILTFDNAETIPSELKLNNIFRRFGTLRETETVIYQELSRARVVFKRSSDAEVAYNSAKIFNIIGSVVKYELGFAPVLAYKAEPKVELENITDVLLETQIPQSEVMHELEFGPEGTYMQQTDSHILEEKCDAYGTLEIEEQEGLEDVVDIMT